MRPPSILSPKFEIQRLAQEGFVSIKQRGTIRQVEVPPRETNNVQLLREEQLMSKAELARRAGLSPLTIDRVEKGEGCRLDTKRKIILALGLKVQDKARVFASLKSRARLDP